MTKSKFLECVFTFSVFFFCCCFCFFLLARVLEEGENDVVGALVVAVVVGAAGPMHATIFPNKTILFALIAPCEDTALE